MRQEEKASYSQRPDSEGTESSVSWAASMASNSVTANDPTPRVLKVMQYDLSLGTTYGYSQRPDSEGTERQTSASSIAFRIGLQPTTRLRGY